MSVLGVWRLRFDRRRRHVVVVEIVWLLLLATFPFLPTEYGLWFASDILIFSLLALSLDLCWGVAGIVSIGHAAFFGAGAYVTAVLATKYELTSGPMLLVLSIAAATLAGLIVGLFLFSGQRDVGLWYIALATIALTYAAERFVTGTESLGADSGIPGIVVELPAVTPSGTLISYYALAAILLAVYLGLRSLLSSRFGTIMRAVREDPERIMFLGYSLTRQRVVVFSLSAGLAGFAGSLSAITTGFVSAELLGLGLSTSVLLWLLVGGTGVFIGALVGTSVLEIARLEFSDAYPTQWTVGIGLLIVIFVVALPGGLMRLAEQVNLATSRDKLREGPAHPDGPERAGTDMVEEARSE